MGLSDTRTNRATSRLAGAAASTFTEDQIVIRALRESNRELLTMMKIMVTSVSAAATPQETAEKFRSVARAAILKAEIHGWAVGDRTDEAKTAARA